MDTIALTIDNVRYDHSGGGCALGGAANAINRATSLSNDGRKGQLHLRTITLLALRQPFTDLWPPLEDYSCLQLGAAVRHRAWAVGQTRFCIPIEMRRIIVSHARARACCVEVLAEHQPPGLL